MTVKVHRKSNQKIKTIYFQSFNGIDDLINWINKHRASKHDYKKYPIKRLAVDFSKVVQLKPYHVVSLACLIREYQEKRFKIKTINASPKVNSYLQSFYFEQFCDENHQNDFSRTTDDKTFPLWKIEAGGIGLYPKHIERYFERNHFNGKSLFPLSVSLSEMLNNVFDHSESFIKGYTFTQYNSQQNTITISVCDFGVGIAKKVQKFLLSTENKTLTSLEAFKKAFENQFTTKSTPRNRGLGLATVLSNVKLFKSKILVLSNNTLYIYGLHDEEAFEEREVYFPGTLVVIWLDTNNLPEYEEELTNEIDLF